ncbi:ABC transporter transmembrane domain-containing protein [Tropicibacter sp. Alg240-R139]|uniref:ABC transporter transmembrane domain-containing protein n=1 Tax=Tropicibacter sp. Alg240-R139 TaxID=2305991 RepID=UPI0013DF6799|nr:ABC transporter transmembrane domain-containing protein [Tropicibacter sp. Alg240-R139]
MFQLYAAIWRVSSGRQIVLIILSLAIAFLAAVPLEFQKDIVNLLTKNEINEEDLFWHCLFMMLAILVSLGLKWLMGYRSGVLGEDIIRLIRARLVEGAVSAHVRGTEIRKGTLSTAVSAEAEELGKFAGAAISEPVVQIGTLVSVIGFIVTSQPGLGTIALAMILPQVIIVLATQRKVNQYVAERVRVLRKATDQLTARDVQQAETAVKTHFDEIYDARRHMFIWKLSTKFLLSTINGVGTVAVLLLGGWLVIEGKTDIGTVVAATIGLGRIQAPTAFLIAFYRQVSANRIKYELLRELIVGTAPQQPHQV